MMHGRGKSSPVIVAGKPANKAQPKSVVAAESAERRMGTKGNADQPATNRTQRRAPVGALGLAAGGGRQLASLPRQAYRLCRMTVAIGPGCVKSRSDAMILQVNRQGATDVRL